MKEEKIMFLPGAGAPNKPPALGVVAGAPNSPPVGAKK